MNNGIVFYGTESTTLTIRGTQFHFEPKALHPPFDPALVFTSKAHVDYVENASRQVITGPPDGTSWDVESWVAELFDQPGQEGACGAHLGDLGGRRPAARALGQDRLVPLRCGEQRQGHALRAHAQPGRRGGGAHVHPAERLREGVRPRALMKVNAVIVDENDVGTFIDKAANLKAIVTNDVIQINRKYRTPIAYQFWGASSCSALMRCRVPRTSRSRSTGGSCSSPPSRSPSPGGLSGRRSRTTTCSGARCLSTCSGTSSTAQGGRRPPGSYYEFSEPAATKAALAEYKSTNDPRA